MNLIDEKKSLENKYRIACSNKQVYEQLIAYWEKEKKESQRSGKVCKYTGGTALGVLCCVCIPVSVYNLLQGEINEIQIATSITLLPLGIMNLYLSKINYSNADKIDETIKNYEIELEKSKQEIDFYKEKITHNKEIKENIK